MSFTMMTKVMRAFVGGRVVESTHPKFQVGDVVTRDGGTVQTYGLSVNPAKELIKRDVNLIPLHTYMSGLGMF